jgi:hypothetical protein
LAAARQVVTFDGPGPSGKAAATYKTGFVAVSDSVWRKLYAPSLGATKR